MTYEEYKIEWNSEIDPPFLEHRKIQNFHRDDLKTVWKTKDNLFHGSRFMQQADARIEFGLIVYSYNIKEFYFRGNVYGEVSFLRPSNFEEALNTIKGGIFTIKTGK